MHILGTPETDNTQDLLRHLIGRSELEAVIIAYLPCQIKLVENLGRKFKLVYDCVDDHTDLDYSYWSSPTDISHEQRMFDLADVVLTTSSSLYLSKCEGRENIFLCRNAVNEKDFAQDPSANEPEDLKDIPHPRICYSGAVLSWFDEELFYKAVDAQPDKSFVVIGPTGKSQLTLQRPNLYKLGTKNHSSLKNYLRAMDIGIIPFKDDIDLIISCNPIKMYEYLACGLPVVSTALPEVCIDREFVRICQNPAGFISAIDEMLQTSLNQNRLSSFVRENTWTLRAKQLLSILKGAGKGHKSKELLSMRRNWRKILSKGEIPVLKALYGLSYAETNKTKFLELAKDAYEILKIKFTLNTYVYALYKNNLIEEAVRVLLSSENVRELYRAELSWACREGSESLIRIKLLYCIRQFNKIKSLVPKLKDPLLQAFEVANYEHEFEKGAKYPAIYATGSSSGSIIPSSPLFHHNAVRYFNYYEGQKHYFQALELTDKYLGRESRLEKWRGLFTDKYPCALCGGNKTEDIIERADGLKLVSCTECGLARLEKMPGAENLHKIYDDSYFENALIGGYNCNYNHQDNNFLFIPRLRWMENTIINKENRVLLDIGCSNGQFMESAKAFGWECSGIEFSRSEYLKALKKGNKVYNGDLRSAGFEDNCFDCITLWDVIEHLISPLDELKEVHRILKPGGKVYFSTPNHLKGLATGKNWFGYNASYEHIYYFEACTLIHLLAKAGFKIDECFSHERGDWNITNTKTIGHILLASARK